MVDGRLRVIPGSPVGARPLIEPGTGVTIWVNGAAITRPRRIEPTDEVSAEADVVEPHLSVSVKVTQDQMQAYLIIERTRGARYALADAPPTLRLKVEARLVEEIPAPRPGLEAIKEALEKAGVRFGLKSEAIERALRELPSEPVLVAEGEPPLPPVDGRVEFTFEERTLPPVDLEAERIDLFERGAVTWVEPGTVLAVISPAREGRPGTNVLGVTIPVPRPKTVTVKAGKGCQLSDDGTQIVAVEAGRPYVAGSAVDVLPVYELKGNADVSTGHVRFRGDVYVRGDVLEGLEVQAGGQVRVGGLVSHARVHAGGNVIVGRTIIGSHVEAGGQGASVHKVLPVLSAVGGQLQALINAARQLRRQIDEIERTGSGVQLSDGEILKRLLERKFWELPKQARKLGELRDRLDAVYSDGRRIAERTVQLLVGAGPLRLRSITELSDLAAELQQVVASVESMTAQEADVMVYSVQNSRIEASGRIIIRGSGAFNSTLVAGRSVEARRGVIRGGQITVTEGDVMVRELGGPTGVPTSVAMARKGKIVAAVVYPHVTVSIAGQKHPFSDGARSLRAYLSADGTLAVQHLKADFNGGERRPTRRLVENERAAEGEEGNAE